MKGLSIAVASGAALQLGLLASAPAFAQSAGAAPAQRSGEIIVTAQKRAENLQDVPIAISVVQGDAISPAVSSVDQLITAVPTLNFRRGGTPLDSSLFLRGVGTINFSIAAEPSVATVVDGVVLARAGEAFGDLYDIQRIEVLRGPQGTLFGKNASAGVVNIVTVAPSDVFGGTIEAAAFEGDEQKLKASVNIPISDTLKTRLSGFVGSYDGNIANLATGEQINGYERWGVRGVADWKPSDRLNVRVAADWRRTNDDGTGEIVGTQPTATGATLAALRSLLSGININGDETREVRHNITSRSKEDGWGVSVQADYALTAGATLTSITAYREWSIYGQREGDYLDRTAAYVGNTFAQVHDYGPQDNSTFSQELRIASSGDERLRYVAGVYYSKAEGERTFRRDSTICSTTTLPVDATGLAPCLPGASTFVSGFSQATWGSEFENYAAFGQLDFDLTERLTLIGGLRFAKDELYAFHDRIPAAAALPGLRNDGTGFRDSTDDTSVTGKAGAQYAFTPDVLGYATYSRGYKGPAFNSFFNQTAQQRNPIPGEDVDSYEAGLKTTALDGRATINVAGFYAEYQNFQANTFDTLNGVVITRLTSAGTISTRGFEAEWSIRPVDNFTFSGGLAYTDAQIEEFRGPDGRLSSAREGERLALAPEWKYTLNADYTLRPQTLPFIVRFDTQYSYTDEQFSDLGASPLLKIDSYGLWDARVTFSDPEERTQFSLIGRNLTDESFASLITPGGPGGSLRFQIPREAERYFGVSIRSKFGG